MKFAALSDIHGNIDALEAVLADARSKGINQFVNLGDICSGPLFPVETLDLLMTLDIPTIRGNHERQLLEHPVAIMGLSDRYAADRLNDRHRAWLKALPFSLQPFPNVLMVHGTPSSDLQYYLHSVTADGLVEATPTEVFQRTGNTPASLILCGHTHIPSSHQIADGPLIINPGSVGLPAYIDDHPYPHIVENGAPTARYAILTFEDEQWSTQFISVDYNWSRAAQQARQNQRPDWSRALESGLVSQSSLHGPMQTEGPSLDMSKVAKTMSGAIALNVPETRDP